MAEQTVFEEEWAFFEKNRDEYLARFKGLFLLIKGTELFGAFPTAHAAYVEGLRRFGLEPFVVKQVLEQEPIAFVPIFSLSKEPGASL